MYVWIAGIVAHIRTGNLPNTSPERYPYTKQLDSSFHKWIYFQKMFVACQVLEPG
jgi:hypothetical protein